MLSFPRALSLPQTAFPAPIVSFRRRVDPAMYAADEHSPTEISKPYLFLAGTFWPRSAVEDAARWTINEVLPLVHSRHPGVHLVICGKGSGEVLGDVHEPDVTIAGQVDSVLPYLRYAAVALVPLRFESGTRFKSLEAGACGKAVVSTTLGAEGVPIIHGKHGLIADSPEDFSKDILRLLDDSSLRKRVGQNLRQLVEKSYSISALADEGRAILDYLQIGQHPKKSEVLIVRQGCCDVDFYDNNRQLVATRELNEGDLLLMVAGGHGFCMLEDAVLLEVKQGGRRQLVFPFSDN